jgi:hypothetical protein
VIEKLKNSKYFQFEKYYIWATFAFLIGQWIIIALTNVNIPAGDEWESLNADALPKGFSWEYVFSFLNEHRGIFTRLQNYLFFRFTDWNMSYQIHWNYVVFSCMVVFLIWFQKKYILGSTKGIWFLTFFLASPILVDNHNWAIQSFFHYCELFGILAIYFATREKVSAKDYWISALLAVCSTYAFAAGMFFAMVVVLVLAIRLWFEKGLSFQVKLVGALPIVLLILGMGAWFIGYHKPPGHPPLTWPYEWGFWYFFSNLISLGFGFKTSSAIIALISLGIVFVVMWKSIKSAFSFRQQYVSFAFFCALAVLGALGSIALSRVGFGIGQAKTSRYAELGILFVPCIGWLWWHLGKQSLKFAKYYKYFVWFICLGFAGDYSYSTYFRVHRERTESVECITNYYRGVNKTGDCPILYPGPIGERLDRAKQLQLSWVPKL